MRERGAISKVTAWASCLGSTGSSAGSQLTRTAMAPWLLFCVLSNSVFYGILFVCAKAPHGKGVQEVISGIQEVRYAFSHAIATV